MIESTTEDLERHARVARLLTQAGIESAFALTPLQGGANSKAFYVNLGPAIPPLFFKEYCSHPDDTRDRLGTEFVFATYAWHNGLTNLARPYVMDRDVRGALYGFLDGRKLQPHEISRTRLHECLQFYRDLNQPKHTSQACALPAASEACFSLNDHWQCLERRVRRLEQIQGASELDAEALEFVQRHLVPVSWAHLNSAHARARSLGIDPATPIPHADRCLSPSDFGFHNALVTSDQTLVFFDFEYAGWDDPAKTVCDFFCQPACPVSTVYYDEFAAAIAADTSDANFHRQRYDLLLPTYQLKWCCIMLNDFLPSGSRRRHFAMTGIDETTRKKNQLDKARASLALAQTECGKLAA